MEEGGRRAVACRRASLHSRTTGLPRPPPPHRCKQPPPAFGNLVAWQPCSLAALRRLGLCGGLAPSPEKGGQDARAARRRHVVHAVHAAVTPRGERVWVQSKGDAPADVGRGAPQRTLVKGQHLRGAGRARRAPCKAAHVHACACARSLSGKRRLRLTLAAGAGRPLPRVVAPARRVAPPQAPHPRTLTVVPMGARSTSWLRIRGSGGWYTILPLRCGGMATTT